MKGWGIYIVVALGVLGYNAMTSADRDGSGAIVDSGNVDAFDIRVGDCFDDSDSTSDEVTSLPGVPCSEPHDNEAYAAFDVELTEYPGDDAMGQLAVDQCMGRFEGFVGTDYDSSTLDIFPMYPSERSWKQSDREVICAIYDMNYEKLVGSVEGSAR
jgi:hypothetical protein